MTPNQTIQQAADSLGVHVEVLLAFIETAGKVIQDAERIKTIQMIVNLPRIMK
jgi:hypothetical protein